MFMTPRSWMSSSQPDRICIRLSRAMEPLSVSCRPRSSQLWRTSWSATAIRARPCSRFSEAITFESPPRSGNHDRENQLSVYPECLVHELDLESALSLPVVSWRPARGRLCEDGIRVAGLGGPALHR